MDLRNHTLASRFGSPDDRIDDCIKTFIMDPVSILNRIEVS